MDLHGLVPFLARNVLEQRKKEVKSEFLDTFLYRFKPVTISANRRLKSYFFQRDSARNTCTHVPDVETAPRPENRSFERLSSTLPRRTDTSEFEIIFLNEKI